MEVLTEQLRRHGAREQRERERSVGK
jgi:hypothetical protein